MEAIKKIELVGYCNEGFEKDLMKVTEKYNATDTEYFYWVARNPRTNKQKDVLYGWDLLREKITKDDLGAWEIKGDCKRKMEKRKLGKAIKKKGKG